MALIQTIKDATPARAWFHRHELTRWLKHCLRAEHLALFQPRSEASKSSKQNNEAFDECQRELVALATAGNAPALYALDIEKMCGQISSASTIVVDFPQRFPLLLRCLAREADPADLRALVDDSPAPPGADDNQETRTAWNLYLESKTRVTHQIQRNIDGFQISTAFRWRFIVQSASFVISFLIALFATQKGDVSLQGAGSALVLALAAAFFAPVARDLLTQLSKR